MRRLWLLAAGLNGLAAVALGALARHLWGDDPHRVLVAETAVRYGLPHAAALIALVALPKPERGALLFGAAGSSLALGVTLFAMSLYALAAGGGAWLSALVPLGGTLMILGWLLLVVYAAVGRRGA